MAGYIYCMANDHPTYGRYLKIGYTERTPERRRIELSQKWRCSFDVLWELEVYEPARAEYFFHAVLDRFRVDYEFFKIEVGAAKALAEKVLDEHWREIEGKEVLPPTLVDLAEHDNRGFLLDADDAFDMDENLLRQDLDHGPDADD